ncbi:zinc finger MYM-type protein 1-like, partial [Aphis craccivora]
ALIPIIETIIFCGEQEISLRGNDDSGPLNLAKPPKKDGKFRALLRYRANFGDENLKNHLINSNRNSTYISPSIQNEIIDICGQLIRKNIVTKINKADCFSILCDETLDVSGTEQLSMCVRYVDQNNQLREDFLCFLPVYDLTGENLTRIILEECEKLGLDLNKLIGQGYDGAGNMSGQFNGVQSRIRQIYPKAVFVHCASHRLNLALSSALSTKSVRNCLGVMKDIINLFRNNALAGETLKNSILELIPETKKTRLVGLFSLQNIQETDRAISAKACSLLAAVEKSCFIISLLVCENLLSFTLPLSHYLQSPKRDLSSAVDYAKHIIKRLKHMRQNSNESFTQIFQEASKLSKMYFDTEIKIPRTTNKQNYRDNYSCNSPEEYYKISVFLPCLDGFILHLENRFEQNNDILSSIEILLPKFALEKNVEKLKNLTIYFEDKISEKNIASEYLLWCEKWKNNEETPTDIMAILDSCNSTFYPNINHLLRVLATLPVSTTEVERSFSTLKRFQNKNNKMESPTFIKPQIEEMYEQRETNFTVADEEEKIHEEQIRIINQKIKKIKDKKKQLKFNYEESQYTLYKSELSIRNYLNSLQKQLESLNID